MLIKIIIVLFLLIIVASLVSGLMFLVRDKGSSERTVKALTVRIGLSVSLFLLLFVAYAAGLIKPHGLYPVPPPQTPAAVDSP